MKCLCLFPLLVVIACSSPPAGNGPQPPQSELNVEPVLLDTSSRSGERVRTTKKLVTSEIARGQKLETRADEAYLTHVLDVDAVGNPIRVERTYERSVQSITLAGGEEQKGDSPRAGCAFEIIQLSDGVSTRLISGEAKPDDYRGMLIAGFDQALLPRGPVQQGQSWEVDINDNPYFSGLLKLSGMSAQRNNVRCQFFDMKDGLARIAISWRAAGTLENGKPIVFELNGELHVDTNQRLVTHVALIGGKTDASGEPLQQISMSVQRERVKGWYK